MLTTIIILSVIIVFVILLLSVITTNKAYQYKHTIDPLEENPHIASELDEQNHEQKNEQK
ncbi:YtzI protein [Bacillus benzoevorans]|uniref:YtzI protein n=1 Tax=Bacillus benzoevorans TaxID=1456 RepID=A0A7X0HRZ7_9BACI|nr:YtzI protein [Bacillus benzoevorans]MBB6445803.1 hypothetical protein [Bacillus benzoevorans]